MDEPPPAAIAAMNENSEVASSEGLSNIVAQAPGNGSEPVEPGHSLAATENAPVEPPTQSQEPPVANTETLEQTPSDSPSQGHSADPETQSPIPVTDPDPPPPPPPEIEEPEIEVPEWVTYNEDTSEITEEELKQIEGSDGDTSALNILHYEKKIYSDVDDPEQRPVKKLRLSWTIKGVRGTKERPNMARVMNSPAAYVDGFYWYIKFFPRGNQGSNLSSYIRCTPEPPKPDCDVPENTFKVFEGPPDANLGEVEPVVELSIPATLPKDEPIAAKDSEETEANSKKPSGEALPDKNTASADDSEKTEAKAATIEPEVDWRISAQLGTVIYNPAEPRTNWYISSEHQFNKHNDDWGWTHFPVAWKDMHIRQKHHRKPLLQDDTLTIDAYIQIFEDPTQALWWHHSQEFEKQWDSKSLAGYFAFGTPPLYHSPGVAGLSTLLLLKPFRDVLQGVDTGRWRKDPRSKPQPLLSQLQIVLFLMRTMKKEELYVNVNPILETLCTFGETFSTVRQFWEILRRSIELELEHDIEALNKLADIFDGTDAPEISPVTLADPIKIPVEGVADVQEGIEKSMASDAHRSFPKFLTIDLDRQKFDIASREWKVLHNRVKLNDEINLSKFSTENMPSAYTLYGFAVHVGERSSGKSYSVLRPNGPGTKWLAFEDGDGNKVFSYTKKRIQDFEGLEGEALMSFRSTRQTAYVAMYVRTDCLKDFLPGKLEPYDEPSFDWIRSHEKNPIGTTFNGEVKPKRPGVESETRKEISVEVYNAANIKGRKGLLDMYNLRDTTRPFQKFTLPVTTTFQELRRMIADSMWIDNVESLRFWALEYGTLGEFSIATMPRPKLEWSIAGRKYKECKPLCLWLQVLETQEDIKLYGVEDPPPPPKPKVDQTGLFGESGEVTSENQGSTDNDGALGLLFPESEDASSNESTPAGTVSTPSSGGNDDQTTDVSAAPDQLQDSVAEAASATVASVPNLPANVVAEPALNLDFGDISGEVEDFDFDSYLHGPVFGSVQDAFGLAGDATPRAVPAEHGHLVDAVTGQPSQTSEGSASIAERTAAVAVPAVDEESAVVIATLIAIPAAVPQPPTEEEPQKPEPRPISHIYGFIQLFDVEQQDFVIHSTFFAPCTADIKATVRKALGYDADRDISVWQRERSCSTSSVNSGATFESIRFRDGVDVIVGEPLSEKTKERLLSEGKFVTPESLSRYIWMKSRRHPVEAFTGTKTINTFGRDYYSGPMVDGRFHGENCKYITSSGHTYTGSFIAGLRQGAAGALTYQNGDVYTGSFYADEKHGQGTFIQKRTGNKYVGGYQHDKRWGKGTMYYEVADEEGEMCQICYGEEMDALFYDCGHVCACMECARQVDSCPICRKSVREVVRVYRA